MLLSLISILASLVAPSTSSETSSANLWSSSLIRSSRQNFGDLCSMVYWVKPISFFQCLSIMNLEWSSVIKGRIVFMFLTLSPKAVNDFQALISLFYGAWGLHCPVLISPTNLVRLSVSILSQRVSFHDSNW
jgi:hypothetical protein